MLVLTRSRLSRLYVRLLALALRKQRTLLSPLLRYSRRQLLRQRLRISRLSLRLKALRLPLSNLRDNYKSRKTKEDAACKLACKAASSFCFMRRQPRSGQPKVCPDPRDLQLSWCGRPGGSREGAPFLARLRPNPGHYTQTALFRNRIYGFQAFFTIRREKVYTEARFRKSYICKPLISKEIPLSHIYDF